MKITHLTQSVTTLGGGLAEAVRALACEQEAAGDNVNVISVRDGGGALSPWPRNSPLLLKKIPFMGINFLPTLSSSLDQAAPELLHVHGLWTYLSIGVPRWAGKKNVPYILSPHGMLESWALEFSKFKKQMAATLYERNALQKSACIHALSQAEAQSLRDFKINNPIAVIPNGVDLPPKKERQNVREGHSKNLLFLSRLHPKKGLENALRAWAQVVQEASVPQGENKWKFVIAGWDQGGYLDRLMALCKDLNLEVREMNLEGLLSENRSPPGTKKASVIFTGAVFGEEKDRLLREADAFILPSFSEGLPISVLEAWAYQLPVLMTPQCNLPVGFKANAAVKIDPDVLSIADGMRKIFQSNKTELNRLGENGKELVQDRFTWGKVEEQMKELYLWALHDSDPPDFVQFNE